MKYNVAFFLIIILCRSVHAGVIDHFKVNDQSCRWGTNQAILKRRYRNMFSVLFYFLVSEQDCYNRYILHCLCFTEKMSWVTYGSPLRHKDKVPTTIKPLPAIATQEKLEAGFVNDAVKTFMFHHSRRQPVIPPYNAEQDKCAQAYFQSPIAKAVLERSMQRALAVKVSIHKLSPNKRILILDGSNTIFTYFIKQIMMFYHNQDRN